MQRLALTILTAVALSGTFLHAGPLQAQQCACVLPEVLVKDMQEDYYPRAQLIINGTAGELRGGVTQVTVTESFKGPPAGDTVQIASLAGECSYEIAPPGSEHFIMALATSAEGLPQTNRCTTFPIESVEAQQVSAAARAAAEAVATPTPEGEPTAAASEEAPTPSATAESGVTPPVSEGDDDGGSSTWLIVGIAVGAAAVLAVGAAGVAYYRRRS